MQKETSSLKHNAESSKLKTQIKIHKNKTWVSYINQKRQPKKKKTKPQNVKYPLLKTYLSIHKIIKKNKNTRNWVRTSSSGFAIIFIIRPK